MFVSSKLIYTELHKTGGSHIGRWLAKLIEGEQIGKHNRIPKYLWDRYIIGSVRNPWDWYVSLWAYGCGKQGGVYCRTTRRFDCNYYNRQLHSEMGLKITSFKFSGLQFWHDALKPVRSWQKSYHDYRDAAAFRRWLHLLFDKDRRFDVGEGYGFSAVSHCFGLMTYRLLKLYTRLEKELYKDPALGSLKGIQNVWEQKRLTSYMIRSESLEDDFLSAMDRAGCLIPEEQKIAVRAARKQKTNTSKRLPVGFYYDQEALDLVNARDQFIVRNFAYEPPEIVHEEAFK